MRVCPIVVCAILLLAVGTSAQTLTLREDLRIGEAAGEPAYEFSRISWIVVGSDGSLYVVNGASSSIRVFSPQGKFVREIGRRGSGPGEFQFFSSLSLSGDTLYVVDGRSRRVTLMDTSGKLLTTWNIESNPQTRGTMFPVGRAVGGWYVVPSNPLIQRADQAVADTTRIHFTSEPQKGFQAQLRPVVSYPGPRLFGIPYNAAGHLTASYPLFEATPRHSQDGRGNLYVPRAYEYRIDVYDVNGRLLRSVTRPHKPVPVKPEWVEAYRKRVATYYDTMKAQHSEWHIARAAEEGKGKLPTRANLPALGRLLVSARGTILVERPDLRPDPVLSELPSGMTRPQQSVYDLFDPTGRFLGSAQFAPTFRPLTVTETSILGVARDELDVEYVVRYIIRNP
jgi:hypothetical protein